MSREKRNTIIVIIITIIILIVHYFNSKDKLARVRANSATLYATIIDLSGCYRTSNCIDFEYYWNDKRYTGSSSVYLKWANFCERHNECKNRDLRIMINKKKPEEFIVYLDTLYYENGEIYVIFD